MLNLLSIPPNCICNSEIPLEKILSDDLIEDVESILWYATLKPSLINVAKVMNESTRYEEIQVFKIILKNADSLYDIGRCIFKRVKYPCVLIINYNNKYLLGTCHFSPGKTDYNENILKAIRFSHWLYPENLTIGAKKMIDGINQSFTIQSDLKEIYTSLNNEIEKFLLCGITKSQVDKILKTLLGSIYPDKRDKIMKYCTPLKKYSMSNASIAAKYDKSMRTSNYTYSYDLEDIWYCLMQYEFTRKIITARRYRDIEDLMYSVWY